MENEISEDVWELRKGETLIGRLEIFDQDMFWFSAHFEPTPEFQQFKVIFDEGNEITLSKSDNKERLNELDPWLHRVNNLGLCLVRLWDGASAHEFILYIDDGDASFRPRFDDTRPK